LAKNDIVTWLGVVETLAAPLTASQDFNSGDVVVLTAAGTISEASDDPASVAGVASEDSTDADGASYPAGRYLSFSSTASASCFITSNFATDGAGTAATPTQANVGDLAGLTLSGGIWSIDTGTANTPCEIMAVINWTGTQLGSDTFVAGQEVDDPGLPATRIVFRFS